MAPPQLTENTSCSCFCRLLLAHPVEHPSQSAGAAWLNLLLAGVIRAAGACVWLDVHNRVRRHKLRRLLLRLLLLVRCLLLLVLAARAAAAGPLN